MQRLFRFMKDKEVEDIEEDPERILETSKSTTAARKKWDSGKEMEAKVTYHYPRGSFRFPLIPDEDKSERAETIFKKEPQKKTEDEKRRVPQQGWDEKRRVPQQGWDEKRRVP